jgi:hypothetical protein
MLLTVDMFEMQAVKFGLRTGPGACTVVSQIGKYSGDKEPLEPLEAWKSPQGSRTSVHEHEYPANTDETLSVVHQSSANRSVGADCQYPPTNHPPSFVHPSFRTTSIRILTGLRLTSPHPVPVPPRAIIIAVTHPSLYLLESSYPSSSWPRHYPLSLQRHSNESSSYHPEAPSLSPWLEFELVI